MLAHCLIIDNRGEIEMAQFALQHSQNDDVKNFAQQLISDHSKMLASLERLGRGAQSNQGAGGTVPQRETQRATIQQGPPQQAQLEVPSEGRPQPGSQPSLQQQSSPPGQVGAPQAGQPGATSSQPAGVGAPPPAAQSPQNGEGKLDWAALKEELGQQCLRTAKDELGQKQGTEFDKCYIGMQIGAHKHAYDTMMVFSNHAGPELESVIDEGMLVVQTHWDHAKDLKQKLEGKTASNDAATRTATEQPRR